MQRKIDDSILAYKQAGDAHYRASKYVFQVSLFFMYLIFLIITLFLMVVRVCFSCSFYNAAKSIEMVGNIMRDDKRNPSEVARVYKKAAEIFQEDGKPERAGEVLNKAIKVLEREYGANNDRSKSEDGIDMTTGAVGVLRSEIIDIYRSAIDAYDDKFHLSGDMMRSFNAFLVREGEYAASIENIKRQIIGFEKLKQPHNIWKCYLSTVILHLKMDDWPAADNAHQSFVLKHPEYTLSDEGKLAQQFLDAFERYDEELLKRTQESNKLKFLDVQVCKIARALSITGSAPASAGAMKPTKRREEVNSQRAELFGGAADEFEASEEEIGEEEKQHERSRSQLLGDDAEHEPSTENHDEDEDNEERAYDPYDFT